MIARYNDNHKEIRVSHSNGTVLCDIPYDYPVANELLLDMLLKRVRLRRNNDKWHKHGPVYETKVRWK